MSDACCCVDFDPGDCEPVAVYRSEWRVARKAHQCSECNRTISCGDAYEYVAMCCDGGWQTFKTCSFCKSLVRDYCCGQHLHGELADILWECLDYSLTRDEFREEAAQ